MFNRKFLVRVCVILLSLVLVGCGRTISTRVNTFSAPVYSWGSTAFLVVIDKESKPDSLESQSYKSKVESALRSRGYHVVSQEALAELQGPYFRVVLSHHVERLEDVRLDPDRAYLTANSSPRRSGFGVGFVVLENGEQVPNYLREISLVIERDVEGDTASERVYESTGQSEGRCGVLSEVFDPMLAAMLRDFPSTQGGLQVIRMPLESRCY